MTQRSAFDCEGREGKNGHRMRGKLPGLILGSVLALFAVVARAEPEAGDANAASSGRSASEVAAELANPNTVLGSLTSNLDYVAYEGDLRDAEDQRALRLTFQPSLPYPLGKGVNLYVRPAIPLVLQQDLPEPGGFHDPGFNLGEIGFDAAIGKSLPNGVVLVGGVVGTLPTATDDDLGKDQWALGPEALAAVVRKWGVLGLLVTHQWDVAGDDDVDTSLTGGQYFYTFNLEDGWQISSSPTFAYDHEAPSGDRWSFPVGIGLSKTTILRGHPWKFGLQYWHYVETPDTYGPDWQIRFSVTPVVPLPWGNRAPSHGETHASLDHPARYRVDRRLHRRPAAGPVP